MGGQWRICAALVVVILVILAIQTDAALSSRARSIQSKQDLFRSSSGSINLKDDPQGRTAVVKGSAVQVRLVLSSAVVSKEKLLGALKALSFHLTGTTTFFIEGFLKLENFQAASELEGVRYLDVSYKPKTHVGTVEGEAGDALRVDKIVSRFGLGGSGIKFGVLSNSFNLSGVATSDSDLPPVEMIQEYNGSCSDGCDEGRGMIEVMYDIAPNASYAFATAFVSEAGFAENVIALGNAGCKIVTDDVSYTSEPVFQPGVVEIAIATNLRKNIFHFSAAANDGDQGIYGQFKSVRSLDYSNVNGRTINKPVHRFPDGRDYVQFTVPQTSDIDILLQWNQPFSSLGGSGAVTDLDVVFDFDGEGPAIVADSNQVGTDALELWTFTLPAGTSLRVYLAKTNKGPAPVFYLGIKGTVRNLPTFFSGPTAIGHCSSRYAYSIGASKYDQTPPFGVNPPKLESYSSYGGIPYYYNLNGEKIDPVIYNKPDFVGPDGIQNTFFGEFESGDYRFYGTSCAAPAVAALAGLLIEDQPSLTFSQLRTALKTRAYPFKNQRRGQHSYAYGYGYINGLAAAKQLFSK